MTIGPTSERDAFHLVEVAREPQRDHVKVTQGEAQGARVEGPGRCLVTASRHRTGLVCSTEDAQPGNESPRRQDDRLVGELCPAQRLGSGVYGA